MSQAARPATSPAEPSRRTIEVFRPGTFTPVSGQPITFSAADVAGMAAVYDPATAPAPAVVGHPAMDAPAFGWAQAFRWDDAGQRLVADLGEVEPAFAEAVAAGRYKRISLALFAPDAANNPKPGSWYPKHIGFLGAAAPAVPGLKPVAFSTAGPGEHVFEFGSAEAMRDVAGLFRALREMIIEKFGAEQADRTLPSWTIAWIDQTAESANPGPAYAAPERPQPPQTMPETTPVTQATTGAATPAPETAALNARIAELEARERTAQHDAHAAFCERLVGEGRLTPALAPRAVALLDAASPDDAAQVAFAEAGAPIKATPRQALKDLLAALPAVVTFGQIDTGEGAPVAAFAAPDGFTADPMSAALHSRAVAYQAAHPGTAYMAAVAAVNR